MSTTFSNSVVVDAAQTHQYTKLQADNDYEIVSGTFIIPLAQDTPIDESALTYVPFVVVKAHAPYRLRKFHYTAQKSLTPPIMPSPEDQGPFYFLSGNLNLPMPSINPDASFTWSGTADYLFAEASVANGNTGYVLGFGTDAYNVQASKVSLGSSTSDAYLNVTSSGIGPKVGWNLGKQIDITTPYWTYDEPSFWPAQLLSTNLVIGPSEYPRVTLTSSVSPQVEFTSQTPAPFGPGVGAQEANSDLNPLT